MCIRQRRSGEAKVNGLPDFLSTLELVLPPFSSSKGSWVHQKLLRQLSLVDWTAPEGPAAKQGAETVQDQLKDGKKAWLSCRQG